MKRLCESVPSVQTLKSKFRLAGFELTASTGFKWKRSTERRRRLLPVVHYVRDDGGEEAEQHDRRAGIHDWVQELPRVRGERQHLLQILRQEKTDRDTERGQADIRRVIVNTASLKSSVSKSYSGTGTAFPTIHPKTKMMSSPYAQAE